MWKRISAAFEFDADNIVEVGKMYISKLHLKGYKNTAEESTITLNKGLNILLGENGCGKTAVINGLRLLLREQESFYSFSIDDFYCSSDRTVIAEAIEIDADFSELNEDERITFLSWCDADFNAQLHLRIAANASKPGNVKRRYWGGQAMSSIFEEDTFDRVECIFLPPLRDAEAKLSAGKRSRLTPLLKKQYGDNTQTLVRSFTEFNNSIMQNEEGRHSEIDAVKTSINKIIVESLGTRLGQSINLQFSETTFNKIVENIRMVFFPHSGETDIEKFRDLTTNSLGYNNLLYIATVFSELELIKGADVFTVLLIEEPEAHLHPQLQIKFIKYLESLASTLPNAQVIVSTHSPVLASSVKVNKLIHLCSNGKKIVATTLSEKHFSSNASEGYINRWMDVTKSTMLFSRGVILVEGIAEALVLPKLAELVLQKYNASHTQAEQIASTLDEMGITVINISGVNFRHFMQLFGNFDGSSGPTIPIYCSGLTDRDPGKDIYPKKGENPASNNPIYGYLDEINGNAWMNLYISPLKTFEYDLAIYNPVALANVLKELWPTDTGEVCRELTKIIEKNNKYADLDDLSNDAQYIYKHIESSEIGKGIFAHALSGKINNDFVVPAYIEKAILWACGGYS